MAAEEGMEPTEDPFQRDLQKGGTVEARSEENRREFRYRSRGLLFVLEVAAVFKFGHIRADLPIYCLAEYTVRRGVYCGVP